MWLTNFVVNKFALVRDSSGLTPRSEGEQTGSVLRACEQAGVGASVAETGCDAEIEFTVVDNLCLKNCCLLNR